MPDCSTELTSAVGRKKRRLFISIVTSAVGNIQLSVFQVVNKLSRLCRLLDEQVPGSAEFPDRQAAWSREGLLAAEKILLMEKNTLFDSLINKLTDYPKLRDLLYSMLFRGERVVYNSHNDVIQLASMFGFVKNVNGALSIANRIFETVLYNLFLSEEEVSNQTFTTAMADRNQFIRDGFLDMELLLKKFVLHWNDLYHSADEKFIEENGRKFFLLYLKPVINGVGNYYIEARTRGARM